MRIHFNQTTNKIAFFLKKTFLMILIWIHYIMLLFFIPILYFWNWIANELNFLFQSSGKEEASGKSFSVEKGTGETVTCWSRFDYAKTVDIVQICSNAFGSRENFHWRPNLWLSFQISAHQFLEMFQSELPSQGNNTRHRSMDHKQSTWPWLTIL